MTYGANARHGNARQWRRTGWLCLSILWGGWSALAGEIPATRGTLEWRSGTVVTAKQDMAQQVEGLTVGTRSGGSHLVMQFERPVMPAERVALETAGVRLLNYIGDNAYFAAVDVQNLDASVAIRASTVRCVLPIQRNWKLHPDLAAGILREWSVVNPAKEGDPNPAAPIVAVYVLFHPDVPFSEGIRLVQAHEAWIRSNLDAINGLVIELPAADIGALADEDAVEWIEPPLPQLSPCNDDNRRQTGANTLQAPPYGLDGTGVTVLVYDAGTGRPTHVDFGGRLHVRDTSGMVDHSTHVAGTIGGSGAASGGTYKGMAPAVTLEAYGFEQAGGLHQGFLYTDPGDMEHDYSEAINTYGADLSSNSIGTNTAPNGYPCEWEGNYGATSVLIDTIVRGDASNPLFTAPFRVLWANGNERQTTRCLGIEGFLSPYHSTAPPSCAKNHITCGALNSNDDTVTSFTSFGPTDDGRLKPDISSTGCQSNGDGGVTSCSYSGDTSYTTMCGTSMATPTVAGISALILQDYRAHYPGQPDFRNSTLKCFLAHTAVDIVTPGPDYQSGYGSIRAPAAVDLERSGNFFENEMGQGQSYVVDLIVAPGSNQLKVTLAWDDYPGTPDVNPVLVNDLDLRVIDQQNNVYYPWTLDPANPAAAAVRTHANHVDNIEQVVIDNPVPGTYHVEIYGYNVPQGPQPFSVTGTPYLVNCTSAGIATLDRAEYPCTGTATMQVVDCDLNTSGSLVDTVTVNIKSTSEPAGYDVVLTETGAASAAFRGSIDVNTIGGAGMLRVAPGDTITLTYNDASHGNGQPAVVTATAVVDCTPPAILGAVANPINPHDATITVTTDEPAQAIVHYGLACASLDQTASGSGFHTTEPVALVGLAEATTYYYTLEAADQAGNTTTDDNGGACYSFTTPAIPKYFTELLAPNDLDYRSLTFVPNGSSDFYAGCAETITQFPTDPTGGTVLTMSDYDDGYALVFLSGGAQVWLYGVPYNSFYVGTNGYITFGVSDIEPNESYSTHFSKPRVAALFDDLVIGFGSISWKQLADRAVVTWQNMSEYQTGDQNSFQIELFFDGRIKINCLAIAASDGLAGLSRGSGVPTGFQATDLSAMGPCGPRPPGAAGGSVLTPVHTPLTITLLATDDGLPNPPGALTYIVTALPTHGTLHDPGAGTINAAPYTLVNHGNQVVYTPAGSYAGLDSLLYKANDGGTPPSGGDSNVGTIAITVGGPQVVYNFPLDTNPGWATQGQWAFGVPQGLAGDPSAGHTGTNVYGYNLAGGYINNMPRYYLTTTPLDCSDVTQTTLKFWRWLGVESSSYDHAGIDVSLNGVTWTTVWEFSGSTLIESAWSQQSYDISPIADHQPVVYIRWAMGTTDVSVTYSGWNIDDIEIWGMVPYNPPPATGDMNCDGVLNNQDIDPFVLALLNPDGYAAQYPNCDILNGDFTGDGALNNQDIDPFVAALFGG